jgi:hypothetical protein
MAAVAGALKSALGLTVAFQTAAVILFLSAFALARLGAWKGLGSRAAA